MSVTNKSFISRGFSLVHGQGKAFRCRRVEESVRIQQLKTLGNAPSMPRM
jgi:hypothetical protein